jgi:hypothetical protein
MTVFDRFSSFTFGECKTGGGQFVRFTCVPGEVEKVAQFLGQSVRTITLPVASRVGISHGTYGQYSRYEVIQCGYAGGGPGEEGQWAYIEILEIQNPPDGRSGIVIHQCSSIDGAAFSEWETLDHARAAFAGRGELSPTRGWLSTRPGFKRFVPCGLLTPWFYAIGNEELIGDYAFPEGLQDDPVYRFGKKFLVLDEDEIPSVKTCMGVRFVEDKEFVYPHKLIRYRIVSWNDGTMWNELQNQKLPPRPLEEGEVWVVDAIREFRQLLAGKKSAFTINFPDGHTFTGELKRSNDSFPSAEGRYFVVAHIKGEEKSREGWVDFVPTREAPDVLTNVIREFAAREREVESIEIRESKEDPNGKKWAGVFSRFSP